MKQVKFGELLPLLLLTITAIVFVTAELIPAGIIPEISASLHAPIGVVGLMVTSYAWTVALSAFLLTALCAKYDRKKLLVTILFTFAIANTLVSCATSLSTLFLARILGAFSHGVFWAIVGSVGVQLAENFSKARATAIVFSGIAIATVIAVPIGTVLAQYFGWRMIFILIAVISFITALTVYFSFPQLPSKNGSHFKKVRELLRYPLLRRVFPATALALTGHFCAFTYIATILAKSAAILPSHLAFYLFLFGAAGIMGNIFASTLADRKLKAVCCSTMVIMALAIIYCVYLPSGTSVVTASVMIIWGASICILTTSLQALILTIPTEIADAASAIHVSMFNTGIGMGAFLGGILVDHVSVRGVGVVGSIMLLIAAIVIGYPLNTLQSIKTQSAKF